MAVSYLEICRPVNCTVIDTNSVCRILLSMCPNSKTIFSFFPHSGLPVMCSWTHSERSSNSDTHRMHSWVSFLGKIFRSSASTNLCPNHHSLLFWIMYPCPTPLFRSPSSWPLTSKYFYFFIFFRIEVKICHWEEIEKHEQLFAVDPHFMICLFFFFYTQKRKRKLKIRLLSKKLLWLDLFGLGNGF